MVKILEYTPPKPIFLRPEILLHPNIPTPLHGVNPRSILGKKWWDEKRKEAYSKNLYCCWACGVHKSKAKFHQWLEGHETYKIDYSLGKVEFLEVVALCHSCHNYIHDKRLASLVRKGLISSQKYQNIMKHGNNLVKDLRPPNNKNRFPAQWHEWHLFLDGKKYYSNFMSEAEWSAHYGDIPSVGFSYEDEMEMGIFLNDINGLN